MERATISEIKKRLSASLKKVRAGQAILILDRDQPVARLDRVEGADQPDDRLTRHERAGLVRRSTRPVPTALLRESAPRAEQSVVQVLLEERRETR